MRIHRDDAIETVRYQRADNLLADRLAFPEGNVLAHVAKVRRNEQKPSYALATKCLRGKQQRQQFVVGLVERRVDDSGFCRRSDHDTQLAIRKPVHVDDMQGQSQMRCKPTGVIDSRLQCVNGSLVHCFFSRSFNRESTT
jgi:hypothetical protein